MNIFNLLTKEKRVAGIEISDLVVRIAYFQHRNKIVYNNVKELDEKDLILFEAPLPTNVVSGGVILNKELLGKTLKNIWRKEKLNKRYAIVSIQEDKIYSRNFRFPKTESEEHLKQAVDLAIDFQLPVKKEDVYAGWENTNNKQNEADVLISAIPKNIVNDYINVMDYAGISILALESHIASISRSILSKEGEVTLITKNNQESTTIFNLKDSVFQFSRTIPSSLTDKNDVISAEVSKIKNYLESEAKTKVEELPLVKAQVKKEYGKEPVLNKNGEAQSKWLVCLGAAIRGELPNGKDEQISLLPIGTVEAYEFQKSKIFITLIRNTIIGVSLFFLLTFLAAYLFIFSLAETINRAENNIPVAPAPLDVAQKESLIKEVNSLTLVSQAILSNTPNWSVLIDEINSRTTNGIIILNFRVPSIKDTMIIAGVSKNREALNLFKKSLQESTYITGVELPINNLEQKEDIPFSISFHLKDPNMLYYK